MNDFISEMIYLSKFNIGNIVTLTHKTLSDKTIVGKITHLPCVQTEYKDILWEKVDSYTPVIIHNIIVHYFVNGKYVMFKVPLHTTINFANEEQIELFNRKLEAYELLNDINY